MKDHKGIANDLIIDDIKWQHSPIKYKLQNQYCI